MADVRNWLRELGMSHLIPAFQEYKITLSDMLILTTHDMIELGMNSQERSLMKYHLKIFRQQIRSNWNLSSERTRNINGRSSDNQTPRKRCHHLKVRAVDDDLFRLKKIDEDATLESFHNWISMVFGQYSFLQCTIEGTEISLKGDNDLKIISSLPEQINVKIIVHNKSI
jgi:hypothetical protein